MRPSSDSESRGTTVSRDSSRLPRHVGIIMDGNGRWAQARGRPRTEGHLEGVKAAKRVVAAAAEAGLRYLSLYTFSTENWARAQEEVSYLMLLIRSHLKKEYDFYRANRIRILHSGDLGRLPPDIAQEIDDVTRDTESYTGLTVNLSINYGGRDEIIRAFNRYRDSASRESLTEDSFRRYLDHPELPDPDLIIRSANEQRLSNFLLWESAYAELYFSPKLWPDWNGDDLKEALLDYSRRVRRFGGST
ncbi:MAG TPA: polyprenyl diphosphate synthase [Spirochaetia bacterium]|nr:polyprenyl diphosphate synthase [Spirochaetia bacterium]